MTIVVATLAIAVTLLAVLVVGLLRSHAVILRRLHELGAGADPEADGEAIEGAEPPRSRADPALPRPPAVADGRVASDITGLGPGGEARAVRIADARHDTVLVFLSTGCATCQAFWQELGDSPAPAGVRLIIVTKGQEDESPVAVADVAPPAVTLVMSSQAWRDYQVPGSPYVVHVDGPSGRVRGEGTGPNWAQVQRMLLQGAGDSDARRAARGGGIGHNKAAADAGREQDVDRILAGAGIQPGDPSLYTRADGTVVESPR